MLYDNAANGGASNVWKTGFYPTSNDGMTVLGHSNYRWGQIYSTKSTISTSDLNQKRNLNLLEEDERYVKMFDLIAPYSFMLMDGDRRHTGFIAQYVEEAMEAVGLTDEECGFFCKDIRTEFVEKEDGSQEEVTVCDEYGNPIYIYSLRYEEYIAIITAKVKQQENKIQAQADKISALEERLAKLEALLIS
jgi:hypothetical protein